MSSGLLVAALIAISPLAADPDFHDQNPLLLLHDPKIAPLVGVTEEQKPALQGDLNDFIQLTGDQAKLRAKAMRLKMERMKLQREGVELEAEAPTFEAEIAEFDVQKDVVQRAAVSRLSPEQTQRLSEISFQLIGIDAFSNPRHRAKLGMTNADMAMASPLVKETVAKFRELHPRDRTQRLEQSESNAKMAAFELETIAKIVSQLEPETRATYDRLAGEPIDVSRWETRKQFGIEPVVPAPAAKPPAPAP